MQEMFNRIDAEKMLKDLEYLRIDLECKKYSKKMKYGMISSCMDDAIRLFEIGWMAYFTAKKKYYIAKEYNQILYKLKGEITENSIKSKEFYITKIVEPEINMLYSKKIEDREVDRFLKIYTEEGIELYCNSILPTQKDVRVRIRVRVKYYNESKVVQSILVVNQ